MDTNAKDVDYSKIEARLLAHHTGKPLDVHTKTASEMFGVPVDQVTQKMRRRAKAVNFWEAYGGKRPE